jgi:hypothetical protein
VDAANDTEAASDGTSGSDGAIADASGGHWLVYRVNDCLDRPPYCQGAGPSKGRFYGAKFYAQTSGLPVMVSELPPAELVGIRDGAGFSPDGRLFHYLTSNDAVVVDMTADVPGLPKDVPQPSETDWSLYSGFGAVAWTAQSKITYRYPSAGNARGARCSVFILEPDGTTPRVNVTGDLWVNTTLGNFGSWSPMLPILERLPR